MYETPSYGLASVMAPHPAAARAGRDVLIEGGNAIEAAVTAAAVLSVVLPQAGGVGGDAVALIREAGPRGRTRVLDARGTLGDAVSPRAFRDRGRDVIPHIGPLSILTVPGVVAGWRAALELSAALGGRLPLRRLLEPAIETARQGFAAPDPALRPLPPEVTEQPGFADAMLVGGRLPGLEDLRHAPLWGDVLAHLAQAGLDDLYRGDTAREIARDLEFLGSLLSRDDLRRFEPRWREPAGFRGAAGPLVETIPTGAGSRLLVSLALMERLPKVGDATQAHCGLEAMKQAERLVADAADAGRDIDALIASQALGLASLAIDARHAAPGLVNAGEASDLAWFGVIDGSGLAVSLCQCLGTSYGSGCWLRKTGVLLGNRGAAFDIERDGPMLRAGRRAPLRALPVIVSGVRGPVTTLGASSWTLASSILVQSAAGKTLAEAVATPRALPAGGVLLLEDGADPSVAAALDRAGHDLRPVPGIECGEASALTRRPGGRIDTAPDPRRDGTTAGF